MIDKFKIKDGCEMTISNKEGKPVMTFKDFSTSNIIANDKEIIAKLKVDNEDLQYLIDMCYGYIDDELGGMDGNSEHVTKLNDILSKYNIKRSTAF